MKLLKATFKQLRMFERDTLVLDLYAEDKVPAGDGSAFCLGKPVYSNCVMAFAGINATGKTTVLSLLDFAINVACGRALSSIIDDKQLLFRLAGGVDLELVFEQSGSLYVLASKVTLGNSRRVSNAAEIFEFADETLYRWVGPRMPKKSLLANVQELLKGCEVHARRSDLQGKERSFLSRNVSIATSVSDADTPCIFQSSFDSHGGTNLWFDGAREALRVLDPSVTYLQRLDDDNMYSISFAPGFAVAATEQSLDSVLSSGTIKGLRFVESAVGVLSQGGYLLVDEIENHLNKQLVNVLIDLFQSHETNPNGATLVFTTHYPEVLDRVHRKDNVYFLVRSGDEYRIDAVKYSDKVKRIENKKSEVFLSNYIGGTAPRYTDVQALRSLVREAVAHAEE